LRANNPKSVTLRLAGIYEQSSNIQKAEEIFNSATKKFGFSSKVWTLFAELLFRTRQCDKARALLPRGLKSLEKRKHIKTITKFAQLEFAHGSAERGRTIFEGLVDSHPKRLDIWSIYIDMEAVQHDIERIRALFDRVLGHQLTSHKAKFLFKKWLALEKRFGDSTTSDNVLQRAIAWNQKFGRNIS